MTSAIASSSHEIVHVLGLASIASNVCGVVIFCLQKQRSGLTIIDIVVLFLAAVAGFAGGPVRTARLMRCAC